MTIGRRFAGVAASLLSFVALALPSAVNAAPQSIQSPKDSSMFSTGPQGLFGPVSVHLKAGDLAPDLQFTKVLQTPGSDPGTSVNLSGKVTVIVFFPLVSRNPQPIAMWNELVARFADKPIEFVLITSEKESSLLPWLAQHPMRGWVLYDSEGRTGNAYGLEVPVVVYIGADRRIAGFSRTIVPEDRTLNAVLEGHITTTRPKPGTAEFQSFLQSGLVLLDDEPAKMPRFGAGRPNFPPSEMLHVSEAKDEPGSGSASGPDFWSRKGFSLKSLLAESYGVNPIRVVLSQSLDGDKRYDMALVLPRQVSSEEMRNLVRQKIQDYFQLSLTHESRISDVYVVKAVGNGPSPSIAFRDEGMRGSAIGFIAPDTAGEVSVKSKPITLAQLHSISMSSSTLDEFCFSLERSMDRPVLNDTNLSGRFEFKVKASEAQPNDFLQLLEKQMNLAIAPAEGNVEVLVFKRQ